MTLWCPFRAVYDISPRAHLASLSNKRFAEAVEVTGLAARWLAAKRLASPFRVERLLNEASTPPRATDPVPPRHLPCGSVLLPEIRFLYAINNSPSISQEPLRSHFSLSLSESDSRQAKRGGRAGCDKKE
uniref:Uncharacterized protein n=1 Tax=Steinernema glaseri TaxID=37863 RepID=A0A1I7Y6W5_9BILA